jgi:hypothetical protein
MDLGGVAEDIAELAPVDLCGFALGEIEHKEGFFRLGCGTQRTQIVSQDGDAAGVSRVAQLLEDVDGGAFGRRREELLDLGGIGIENRAPRRSRLG